MRGLYAVCDNIEITKRGSYTSKTGELVQTADVIGIGLSAQVYSKDVEVTKHWPAKGFVGRMRAALVPWRDGTFRLGDAEFEEVTAVRRAPASAGG